MELKLGDKIFVDETIGYVVKILDDVDDKHPVLVKVPGYRTMEYWFNLDGSRYIWHDAYEGN